MDRSFLQWIDGYAVGHGGLDAEHLRLVGLINDIHVADLAGNAGQVACLLDMFRQAAAEHLGHENAVMREVESRAAQVTGGREAFLEAMSAAVICEHIIDHTRSLQQLDAIIRAFHATADTGAQVGDALKAWFVEHAIKYDAHLKAVFQAM
jgi:hemerythrin